MRLSHVLIIVLIIAGTILVWRSRFAVNNSSEAEVFYKLAIERHDISICDKVHGRLLYSLTNPKFTFAENCYTEFAIANPYEHACLRFGDRYASVESDIFSCVKTAAKSAKDPELCKDLDDTPLMVNCIIAVAYSTRKPEACQLIADASEMLRCINTINDIYP